MERNSSGPVKQSRSRGSSTAYSHDAMNALSWDMEHCNTTTAQSHLRKHLGSRGGAEGAKESVWQARKRSESSVPHLATAPLCAVRCEFHVLLCSPGHVLLDRTEELVIAAMKRALGKPSSVGGAVSGNVLA